jgi:hypothetical protein
MATAREMLSTIYAHAGAGEWDKVEALVHPEFIIYEAEVLPYGGEWRGRDAMTRCAAAMVSTWEKASVEIHEFTGGDEWGTAFLTLTMTSKKTGRTFSQTISEVGRFENGLLKELRIHYFDAAEVAAEA